VLFAIPGGWFGKRFGDKRVVLTGLAMMTVGGALLALSDVYEIMFAGRLISVFVSFSTTKPGSFQTVDNCSCNLVLMRDEPYQ
jgi:MFS family permease